MSEFIGFFLAIFFLIISALSRRMQEKDRREHPEKYKEMKERERKLLKELLGELDEEEEAELSSPPLPPLPSLQAELAEPPPPPPILQPAPVQRQRVSGDYDFHSRIESRSRESNIEDRSLDIHVDKERADDLGELDVTDNPQQQAYDFHRELSLSRSRQLLNRLDSKGDMLLLHEIFGPPKGLQ